MSQERISTQHREPEDLIGLLKQTQRKFGYVPEEAMAELARSLDIPINDVYGVASFYSFLSTWPLGRNVIRICQSLPCYLKHSQTIIESVGQEIGIQPGETTADGRYSFQLTNCIGLCDRAPAMLINNDPHVDLNPKRVSQILRTYE